MHYMHLPSLYFTWLSTSPLKNKVIQKIFFFFNFICMKYKIYYKQIFKVFAKNVKLVHHSDSDYIKTESYLSKLFNVISDNVNFQ